MEEKLKLLQEMATTEGDIRDGNIGSFSQGVVVGERNASRLALEIIESIKRGDKEPYIPSPIYMTNLENGLVKHETISHKIDLIIGNILYYELFGITIKEYLIMLLFILLFTWALEH
jgi:hypothetical protein